MLDIKDTTNRLLRKGEATFIKGMPSFVFDFQTTRESDAAASIVRGTEEEEDSAWQPAACLCLAHSLELGRSSFNSCMMHVLMCVATGHRPTQCLEEVR